MGTHYHTGHGFTGYGPEEPGRCDTLECLASCVREELEFIAEQWGDQAHGERYHIEQLRRARPDNGADPVGYPGSWESIATAALRALECLDNAETAGDMRLNLRPDRAKAPLYQGNPEAWQAELQRLLIDGGTYPLETTIDGNVRFYAWECTAWECRLSEHDNKYAPPLAARTEGGNVPCACRDCMNTLYWSPTSWDAPYCHWCESGDCADRERSECTADQHAGDE